MLAGMTLVLAYRWLEDIYVDRIRAAAPSARIEVVKHGSERFHELLPEVEAVIGGLSKSDLAAATRLRWLQVANVGAGELLRYLPPGVTLTNARGSFGYIVAEHGVALMLAVARELQRYARLTTWQHDGQFRVLRGGTICLLGAGDIGRNIARTAKALGMHTIGINRSGQPQPPPEGVDELYDMRGLDAVLPRCGFLVNSLPLTAQTRHLLDARRLALLPEGAIVVNVGRGGTVDEGALIDALRSGRLGGAGLDVAEHEPLPSESPLWSMPNVLISPHIAGFPGDHAAFAELVAENLKRFLAHEPLLNVVQPERGY